MTSAMPRVIAPRRTGIVFFNAIAVSVVAGPGFASISPLSDPKQQAELLHNRHVPREANDMTTIQGFSTESFQLLRELAQNNNREWYTANKARFRMHLEAPFAALLEALSNRLTDAPRPLMGDRTTMFRLNRDIRFSADKSPYKTNVSGLLTPSGTKSQVSALLYVHLDPAGSFAAAGYYNLSPKQLGPVRDAMVARADEFDDVLDALSNAGRSLADMGGLTGMPRGYAQHAEHRHAPHIKRKSLIVREDVPEAHWFSGQVIDRVERLARDAMPLLTFQDPKR